jgi:hypothetical protein
VLFKISLVKKDPFSKVNTGESCFKFFVRFLKAFRADTGQNLPIRDLKDIYKFPFFIDIMIEESRNLTFSHSNVSLGL